jgi:hypothetical protein
MVSTTATYWFIRSIWNEGDPVFEVECFVASDMRVIPVPGDEFGYTGYAMKVGDNVFATKSDAEIEAIKRAESDIEAYKNNLRRVEARLARLQKGA